MGKLIIVVFSLIVLSACSTQNAGIEEVNIELSKEEVEAIALEFAKSYVSEHKLSIPLNEITVIQVATVLQEGLVYLKYQKPNTITVDSPVWVSISNDQEIQGYNFSSWGGSASDTLWNQFITEEANLNIKNGIIYQRSGNQQIKAMIDSIDPTTDKPSKTLTNKAPGLVRKEITLNHDGYHIDLAFDYVMHNGVPVALPIPDHEPRAGYQLFPYPGTSNELIEFQGTLYVVDLEKGSIEKILNDISGSYSFEETKEKSKQDVHGDSFFWWGARPSVNPSGNMMAFYTDRSGESEIWIKDLITGNEHYLLKSALTIKGWLSDTEFIASSFSEVLKMNIETGEVYSYGDAIICEVSLPYLIIQKEAGTLMFIDTNTEEERVYAPEGLGTVVQITALDGLSTIAISNQPNRTQPETHLSIIETADFTTKMLKYPASKNRGNIKWIDKNTILLVLIDRNTNDEESIFVDIDKL